MRLFWSKLATKESIAPAVSKVYSDWEGSTGKLYYRNAKISDEQEPKKRRMQLVCPTGSKRYYFLEQIELKPRPRCKSWENVKKCPLRPFSIQLSNKGKWNYKPDQLSCTASRRQHNSKIVVTSNQKICSINKLTRVVLCCKKNQEIVINYCTIAHATINLKGHSGMIIDFRRCLARRSLPKRGVPCKICSYHSTYLYSHPSVIQQYPRQRKLQKTKSRSKEVG